MKTTLILRDDIVRQSKARAALRGQPLSKYVNDTLERALKEDQQEYMTVTNWIDALPTISPTAAKELSLALTDKSFRVVETEMWK